MFHAYIKSETLDPTELFKLIPFQKPCFFRNADARIGDICQCFRRSFFFVVFFFLFFFARKNGDTLIWEMILEMLQRVPLKLFGLWYRVLGLDL